MRLALFFVMGGWLLGAIAGLAVYAAWWALDQQLGLGTWSPDYGVLLAVFGALAVEFVAAICGYILVLIELGSGK